MCPRASLNASLLFTCQANTACLSSCLPLRQYWLWNKNLADLMVFLHVFNAFTCMISSLAKLGTL